MELQKTHTLNLVRWPVVFFFCSFLAINMGLVINNAQASNQTTCNIGSGYKIYHILRNGKLGKRAYSLGTTQNREYTCIKDRYYNRLRINNKWYYVSVQAERSSTPTTTTTSEDTHPVVEEEDTTVDEGTDSAPSLRSQGSLSNSLALRDNYNIRNNNGDRIGSTLGVDLDRQSVQIKLSAPNTPIVNSDGLVNVQYNYINSRGRSESVDAWVSPEAIIDYDKATAPRASGDVSASNSGNTTSVSALPENNFNIENPNVPKEGDQIRILNGIEALVPKTQPFLASEPVDGIKPLNSGSEIIATGNRSCDGDSKKCFIEVEFSDDTDGEYIGWIDEQQTNVNPENQLLMNNRSYGTVVGTVIGDSDEVADADGTTNNNWYYERFSEEERASHQSIRDFLTNLPRQTTYETNRGMIRMHNDRRGFCGSYHYATEENPTVGAWNEIQTYANPTTACVIARLTQTWKKYHCQDGGNNNGCRLSTGDISHRTLRKFDGHSTHTDGQCVDLRPIRKSGVGPLDFNSDSYDQDKTRDLLKVLKDLGGTNIYFNDPKLIREGLATRASGHHNHIHVCFKADRNPVKNSCSSYAPDYEVCPELRSFFNAPLMQRFKK